MGWGGLGCAGAACSYAYHYRGGAGQESCGTAIERAHPCILVSCTALLCLTCLHTCLRTCLYFWFKSHTKNKEKRKEKPAEIPEYTPPSYRYTFPIYPSGLFIHLNILLLPAYTSASCLLNCLYICFLTTHMILQFVSVYTPVIYPKPALSINLPMHLLLPVLVSPFYTSLMPTSAHTLLWQWRKSNG